MSSHALLRRLARGDVANVRFSDLRRLLGDLGFERLRVSGSHEIYSHPSISELFNLHIADIPDLDACSAFGENPNRAVAEVLVAKEAWLAAAKDAGRPIPQPRYRPAFYTH